MAFYLPPLLMSMLSAQLLTGNSLPVLPSNSIGEFKRKVAESPFSKDPIWADEFNYTGKPDSTKWGYDIGGGGWGNNELEYYTSSGNATVSNGTLKIIAKKESKDSLRYTSARLKSAKKGDWRYGRFEAKIKVSGGKGTWPAFWMLPTDNAYGIWPKSGEIDIMEEVGFDPDVIHISAHTQAKNFQIGNQATAITTIPTATTAFHLYRVDWLPSGITGYVDNVKIFSYANAGKGPSLWPFNKRFHLLLNVAVGGNWGIAQGIDDTIFPATMEVDYVRVYKML